MTEAKRKRKTQKKGGRLWCETIPIKYLKPCKQEEIIAERQRESEQKAKDEQKKQIEEQIKSKEEEIKNYKNRVQMEIDSLKNTPITGKTSFFNFGKPAVGGKKKSQKKSKTKKSRR